MDESINDSKQVNHDPFADGVLERVVSTTEPQREIWLATQLGDEASLAYNESISVTFSGELDLVALRSALIDLVQRHEALRSTVSKSGQELRVAQDGSVRLVEVDLSKEDESIKQSLLAGAAQRAVENPFDLELGPLLRLELLTLATTEHVLIVTAHHLICDGWSFGVIVKDLVSLYSGYVGFASGKLDQPASFASYAVALDSLESSKQAQQDEAYWLEQYSSVPANIDLPTDRPRGSQRTFKSQRIDHVLDQDLVERIKKSGARSGVGFFAALLGGFSSLMQRLSGATDLVVGVPAAGQLVVGQESLVGHCVNFLPIRLSCDPAAASSDLLVATQARLLDAYEHQSCTFGSMLQQLPISRESGRPTLVSVMFNLDQEFGEGDLDCPGLSIKVTTNPRSYEVFELFVNAVPFDGGLRFECQFNAHLFDSQTIRSWMRSFESLLRAASESPDSAICDLDLTSQEDKDRLKVWNNSDISFSDAALIHELVEAQVACNPSHPAIIWGQDSIGYGELDARANQIAHCLLKLGAGADTLVGLHVERGPDMVAALLAVLKVGAAYVPLDPSYPASRLAFMVEDSKLTVLVTQDSVAPERLLPDTQCLVLDGQRAHIADQSSSPVAVSGSRGLSSGLAYVIYTSGSTGNPKGVCVSHRAVVNFLQSMASDPGLTPADRMVAVTTLSFDIAINELLLPLIVGATVVLARREEASDASRLCKLLNSSKATAMQATPSMWRLLLDVGWKGDSTFKAMCGGEALTPDLAERLLSSSGQLWNLYGPTETTVWSTCGLITSISPSITVGRPIANTTVWVLDEHRNVCPISVPGEIWIGGEGVAIGYLHRPDLTTERFVQDPFSGVADARIYRTGDRGRWRSDGSLEVSGRQDFQVKVRGFRIELGEIESTINRHPSVAEAVAITREDQPGDVRIVVYYVEGSLTKLSVEDIRGYLAGVLPDYMIPQHLVCLPELPRLPNGKLDRASLPAVTVARSTTTGFVKPSSATEVRIAAEFGSVLGLGEIGIDDDFFVIGGHSLLAAQLVNRLNRSFDVGLSIRTVFEGPTVRRLAEAIDRFDLLPASEKVQIDKVPDQSLAAASVAQERLWFLENLRPGRVAYHAPSAHRLRGPLNEDAFERAFREIVRRQPSLRTYFERVDGKIDQHVQADVPVTLFPVESLERIPAVQREEVLLARLQKLTAELFDLSVAPLFRAKVFKVSEEEHVFFFMAHHIVWDGWSFDLFYQEMATIYAAYVAGEVSPLADLAVTYCDYAAWHRKWMDGDECERQSSYWRAQLTEIGQVIPLPIDRLPAAQSIGTGATKWVSVDTKRTSSLHALASRTGVTQFIVTLTLFGVLLYDYSRSRKLVIGTPVRGRPAPEFEVIMGYFNNLLVMPVEVDPEQSVVDLIGRVKASVLGGYAAADASLENIASVTKGSSGHGAGLLYQALFSFQDGRQRPSEWGHLRHSMIPLFQSGVTEDIGMWFVETPDGLEGGLTYNTDVLNEATATWLVQRYGDLIDSVIETPSISVNALVGPPTEASAARLNYPGVSVRPVDASLADRVLPEYVAPTNEVEAQLASIWQSVLGVQRVGINDEFFELGGDSLNSLKMISEVEKILGLAVNPVDLVQSPTVASLSRRLAVPVPSRASLVVLRRGSNRNLFMVHDGDGATLLYAKLASLLPEDVTVIGIGPRKLPGVPLAATSIEEMAAQYVHRLRERQPVGPYMLGGLCAGGLIAYEIASQLSQAGETVDLVAIFDAGTPQSPTRSTLMSNQRKRSFAASIAGLRQRPGGAMMRGWLFASMALGAVYRALSWEVCSRIRAFTGGSRVVLLSQLLKRNRSWPGWLRSPNFRDIYRYAEQRYKPAPVEGVRVVLIRAKTLNAVSSSEADRGIDDTPYAEYYVDELMGWGVLVSDLKAIDVDGGHSSMFWEPHVHSLARAIRPLFAPSSTD